MTENSLGMNANLSANCISINWGINIQRPKININNDTKTSDEESSNSCIESCCYQVCSEHITNEIERDAAEDFDNILILENCGMGLNLKDFSMEFSNDDDVLCNTSVLIDSSFVKVTLKNKTSMIIKKSSLCWLLEQPRDRVSSDRLRRFINNSNSRVNKNNYDEQRNQSSTSFHIKKKNEN